MAYQISAPPPIETQGPCVLPNTSAKLGGNWERKKEDIRTEGAEIAMDAAIYVNWI